MRKILIIVIVSLIYGNEQIPAPPQKNPIVLQNAVIHTISVSYTHLTLPTIYSV